jgi:hypothetical protein
MDRLAEHDVPTLDKIHSLLEYLYPSFGVALRNYPNIEDFMNLIEMALQFNSEDFIESTIWPASALENTRQSVLQAITDYLWGQMRGCNLDPIRSFVRQLLRAGDTLITFNWDVTMERVLQEDSEFNFWYKPTTEILLLKPHGSIDWFRRDTMPTEAAKASRKIDDELCVYPEFSLAKHRSMKGQAPVIVPPVSQKDFTPPFFRETWKRIYKMVSAATDISFIGYSLPSEDQFSRLVLSRALRNNRIKARKGKKRDVLIRVVNPDEAAQRTFIRLAGQGVKGSRLIFYHTTFDRFAQSLQDGLITF